MDLKTSDEAQAALRSHQERFAASEKMAGVFLSAMESEARNASVPGIRIAARARQELLLTFAGAGLYFRFVYSHDAEYLEYGWWSSIEAGDRQYISTGEWRITRDGVEGFKGVEDAHELFYPALDASMESREWGSSPRSRSSGYSLRHMVPDSVEPPSPPGP
jgi:hypothetical protein